MKHFSHGRAQSRERASLLPREESSERSMAGVNPYCQTTTQITTVFLDKRQFQTQPEAHTQGWNATASCYKRRR
jgi:hypothetical protein